MSELTTGKPRSSLARIRLGFVLAVVAGLIGFISSPWLQRKIGVLDNARWFLDSHAVLAASDAVRAGINVEVSNPFDVFNRPHSYTDWWFWLADLGLTRDDNFLVGGLWVAAFLAVACLALRPGTAAEALYYASLLLSPPVLLAIVRANNDLLVFVLLGLGALALKLDSRWRWIVTLVAIAIATGLKFYPLVAAALFLMLRPERRMWSVVAISTLVLGLILFDVGSGLRRGIFTLPQSLYTFGAGVIFRDLGLSGLAPVLIGLAGVIAVGFALARSGVTSGLIETAEAEPSRILFVMGSIVLLACFFAGVSYSYRCIFALWLAPWLWLTSQRGDGLRGRRFSRLGLWLLGVVMWADGFYCLVMNIAVGPMAEATRQAMQLRWHLLTQPISWALMALLAAWLLAGTRERWRACHRCLP